jgi:hypothetical protein
MAEIRFRLRRVENIYFDVVKMIEPCSKGQIAPRPCERLLAR